MNGEYHGVIKTYFSDIRGSVPLTREQEAELGPRIRGGITGHIRSLLRQI